MRSVSIVCAILISSALVGSSWAAEKSKLTPGFKKAITGGTVIGPVVGGGGVLDPNGGTVVGLNASDCRLDGGTVVVPGDDRCGKLGAAYCRKPDGFAACLTEQ
jgi:hypothetical protein